MLIAPLQTADAPRYRALMLEAYAQAADAFTSTAEERAAEPMAFWARRIDDPAGLSVVLGADHASALVGAVTVEFSAKPKTRHKGLIVGLYVQPAARGLGAGRALMDAAIGCAQARGGVLRLNLTVTEGNAPAIGLYRRAGFETFGREPMAIRTPEGFLAKLHMGRDLAP
jgi:ribosomal protein S18 acetylase RimI-like enzyme